MVAPDGSKPGKPQLSNFKEKPGMLQHILQWDQAATLWINGSQSLFLDGFFMAITQTVTWLPLIAVLLYVLIRNNTFVNFGTGGENPQSVLQISPEIPTAGRNGDFRYHGRIVFTGNTVRTFDSQVIYALSVDRLEITGNRFIQSRDYPPIFDGLSYIDLQYCREADISGNRFEGDRTVEVSAVACDTVRLDPRQAGFALAVVNKPNTFFYKQ